MFAVQANDSKLRAREVRMKQLELDPETWESS
jgi:hypothetical protein